MRTRTHRRVLVTLAPRMCSFRKRLPLLSLCTGCACMACIPGMHVGRRTQDAEEQGGPGGVRSTTRACRRQQSHHARASRHHAERRLSGSRAASAPLLLSPPTQHSESTGEPWPCTSAQSAVTCPPTCVPRSDTPTRNTKQRAHVEAQQASTCAQQRSTAARAALRAIAGSCASMRRCVLTRGCGRSASD